MNFLYYLVRVVKKNLKMMTTMKSYTMTKFEWQGLWTDQAHKG